MIQLAYIITPNSLPARGPRIPSKGLDKAPSWIESERYQIRAKSDRPESQKTMRGVMLQGLLEERFKLKVHRETRETPIYELTVARGGLKLQRPGDKSCTESDEILRFLVTPMVRMGCSNLQKSQ